MLRYITHNLKERKQGVMALVEFHVDMTCTHQKASETLEEYFRIFMARISTVNAHGRNAGYHKVLYNKHLVAFKEERGITVTTLSCMSSDDERGLMKELDYTAMDSSCEEFNSCLLLLMADGERYNPLKLHLAN